MNDKAHIYITSRQQWRGWLAAHHTQPESIWLVFDKGPGRTLSYDDIVEEALCFGWVDSRPGKVDAARSKLYISPRKPKSVWSKANKRRIAALTGSGRMQAAGLLAVTTAKANGSWDALNASDSLSLPPELERQLAASAAARENFAGFSTSSKRAILEWIYAAKQGDTRQKRIRETAELAANGIKANHWRPKEV